VPTPDISEVMPEGFVDLMARGAGAKAAGDPADEDVDTAGDAMTASFDWCEKWNYN
jgi:hypothetical protein